MVECFRWQQEKMEGQVWVQVNFFFTSCLSLQRPAVKCSLLLGSPPAIYLSVCLAPSSQRWSGSFKKKELKKKKKSGRTVKLWFAAQSSHTDNNLCVPECRRHQRCLGSIPCPNVHSLMQRDVMRWENNPSGGKFAAAHLCKRNTAIWKLLFCFYTAIHRSHGCSLVVTVNDVKKVHNGWPQPHLFSPPPHSFSVAGNKPGQFCLSFSRMERKWGARVDDRPAS